MSTLSFFLVNFSFFSSLLNLSFPQNLQSFSKVSRITLNMGLKAVRVWSCLSLQPLFPASSLPAT